MTGVSKIGDSKMNDWIIPEWPAPATVSAFSTTRLGGFSEGPWRSFNLGLKSGDDAEAVRRNRELLRSRLPAEPNWLQQVHGTAVVRHNAGNEAVNPEADGQVASEPGQVCVVLSADCLPVLFCNRAGTRVAAAHAGWRGLAAGILENTVKAFNESPVEILAWLGPSIGPSVYEVGDDVRDVFVAGDRGAESAFRQRGNRWLFDLYAMARLRLERAGVTAISGGGFCTFSEPERFFSFRRDGQTGRMGSFVWIDSGAAESS